ncbi:Hpt domain-containing protein [Rubrivivax sp. A210]|uniref:Hpt domain-containing protein n=1 Tax=Rubrivivax sp. A210 TaxID=2772301 RepID=UPI0019180294|nr:Hpt domain-containing protein [Rubrivivax sp. A210]
MDSASEDSVHTGDDLSALAWVHGELRRSLDTAHKALRRYLKEAEILGDSDLDAVDPAILRSARTQLHQGVGALELVGLPAVADVLRASEQAVQRLINRPALIDVAAVEVIEHVSFALLDFMARQLAGKAVSPVALFPQYRAALQLAGADRVHPADLWKRDWQWLELPADPVARPRNADDDARSEMETLVLALMRDSGRNPALGPLSRMSDLCAELGAGARRFDGGRRLATFWQLAAAVFEGQAAGLIPSDSYTKRFASRLLAQLRTSMRGQPETSDRLAQDLLFFCSQARLPAADIKSPRLAAVRQAWQLEQHPAVDYETPRLGRFDPALLALARKRVAAARDSWSAAAGGEQHRIGSLVEQFTLVGESLARLFPSGDVLAQALQTAVQQTVDNDSAPPPPLAMEVATSILYLDASLEDGEFDQPELAARIERLASRIDEVRNGADPQPLDLWMEELYRRVSDRQTMGSVVQELRASLSEVEKQIDQYFRNPAERQVLIPVPGQLSAMRGVLSVLGLTQASQAVIHMRDDVDALAQTEVDPQRAIQAGTFDRLADNLGALSFLIDMLSVQPALAKSLFRFDPETGSLSAVMGQSERVSAFAGLDELPPDTAPAPTMQVQVQALADAAAPAGLGDDELAGRIDAMAQRALAADQPELARRLGGLRNALRSGSASRESVNAELAQAAAALSGPAPEALPAAAPVPPPVPAPVGGTGLEEDAEMREIFIEEANEVVAAARAALERLADEPESAEGMTTVRRAFHTLKGSSRMVGLSDFGEAAWACEQLYNARLAHAPRMDGPLRTLTGEALNYFADWAESIAAGRDDGHHPAEVAKAADALRLEGTRLPIALPVRAAPAMPEEALARPAPPPEPELQPLVLDLAPDEEELPALAPTPTPAPAEAEAIHLDLPAVDAPLAPAPQALVDEALQALGLPDLLPPAEAEAADAAAPVPELPELPEDLLATLPEAFSEAAPDPVPEVPTLPVAESTELPSLDALPELVPTPTLPEFDLADLDLDFALEGEADGGTPADAAPLSALAERLPDLPSAADLDLGLPPAAAPAELDFSFDLGDEPAAPPAPEPAELPATAESPALLGAAAAAEPPLADYEATQIIPAPPPTPAGEVVEVDFADLADIFGTAAPAPAPAPEPAPLPAAPDLLDLPTAAEAPVASLADEIIDIGAPELEAAADIGFDLEVPAEPAADLALDFGDETPVAATQVLPTLDEVSVAHEPDPLLDPALFEPAPVADLALDLTALDLAAPEPSAPAESALEAPADSPVEAPGEALGEAPAEAVEEEPVRVIGHLRISIPLFNIFLNEADEQSRRLVTELAEWAVESERHTVPESCAALAHSLAGNCGTVGYAELSALARALEHALVRSHQAGHGRPGEAALFTDAAEEIRRLLHQFAAGFLHGVDAELMARLAEHERLPVPPTSVEQMAQEAADAEAGDGWLPADAVAAAAEPAVAAAAASAAQAESDGIAAVDHIDPDLFPIFEEEAEELLPQLQSRLRDWLDHPGDGGAASACMRTLHTFKGGARLSGAMRLGEMAHRLETAIEDLSRRDAVQLEDIEPLVARADGMSMAFEALRKGGVQARGAVAAPAPVPFRPELPAPLVETPPVEAVDAAPLSAEIIPLFGEPAPAATETESVDEALAAALAVPAANDDEATVPVAEPAAGGAELAEAPAELAEPVAPPPPVAVDWARFPAARPLAPEAAAERAGAGAAAAVRVRAGLLDRMVNQAGEVSITRARIDSNVKQLQGSLGELTDSLERMRRQLRDIEVQAESQISSRIEAAKAAAQVFDPLEMDRFTRFQELTRFMAESVNDVATLQRSLQRTLQSAEDELAAQARLTRELQDDLLRTRMVEFESAADRLHRTVRQAAKETGKQVRMELLGGAIEIDRGVLERMTGPFEHLLRNSVAHGIEAPEARKAAGKDAGGLVSVTVAQAGNEVAVEVSDDGAGLNLERVRARAIERGLMGPDSQRSDDDLAQLIFLPGFSTAESVSELAGRGVGLDVVRAEVNAMGGRIETHSEAGRGTRFRLLLPLTTAVTQVVMLRCGELQVAVPSTLVEIVRRVPTAEIEAGYADAHVDYAGQRLPFFWLAALLQGATRGATSGRTQSVVVIRSANQRVVIHVDEVVGNQEVVVKNVGAQLSRLPGLAGVTLLPSGAVALIYNPVALAAVYADQVRESQHADLDGPLLAEPQPAPQTRTPMVMVVDDSLTVRRVTERLLKREGYRVVTAKDGLDALERLAEERPVVLLSDIEMPRMDGFDLVRNVRSDPRLAGLPVVMISSRIAQKHRDHAAGLGVDHYLGKPYSEEELLGLVARYAGADIPT